MKRTCAIIVPILIVFSLILPALSGNAAATPDDWVQVAGGGVDGNYHAYYHIAQGIATNGSNLYVGLNGAPVGWGPSVWQYDGSEWKIIGDNGIDDANAEAVFSMAPHLLHSNPKFCMRCVLIPLNRLLPVLSNAGC